MVGGDAVEVAHARNCAPILLRLAHCLSQLAHVVALPLDGRPNLVAHSEDLFLSFPPFSGCSNRRYRSSLFHYEQITLAV